MNTGDITVNKGDSYCFPRADNVMGKSRRVNRQFQKITITIFMNISEGGTRYSGKDIEEFSKMRS